MDNLFNVVDLNDVAELEEMVCLDKGGTLACCNGGDGSVSATVK